MTTTTALDPFASLGTPTGTTPQTKNDAASADRFLKLLVAQMQNQDPMNPMENAEITTQMAQINTVSGIETLNATVQGLNAQFLQMQALQGASLVGRDVTVAGNAVSFNDDGSGVGGFELAGAADQVKVEVLDASGRVVDTLQLGALESGRHAFAWAPKAAAEGNHSFRVTATAGAANVPASTLMRDRVEAVNTSGDTLTLELARSGSVPYSAVKAFN